MYEKSIIQAITKKKAKTSAGSIVVAFRCPTRFLCEIGAIKEYIARTHPDIFTSADEVTDSFCMKYVLESFMLEHGMETQSLPEVR